MFFVVLVTFKSDCTGRYSPVWSNTFSICACFRFCFIHSMLYNCIGFWGCYATCCVVHCLDFVYCPLLRTKVRTQSFGDKIDPYIKSKGKGYFFCGEGSRSRCYGRTAALRVIVRKAYFVPVFFKFHFKDWTVDKVQAMKDHKLVFMFTSCNGRISAD